MEGVFYYGVKIVLFNDSLRTGVFKIFVNKTHRHRPAAMSLQETAALVISATYNKVYTVTRPEGCGEHA